LICFEYIYYLNYSLKDFICDSSSDEEDPSEFYPKVNRLIDTDSSWRKLVSLKLLLSKIQFLLLELLMMMMMIIHQMNHLPRLQKVIINQQQRKKI
jgi:hypothetical protein